MSAMKKGRWVVEIPAKRRTASISAPVAEEDADKLVASETVKTAKPTVNRTVTLTFGRRIDGKSESKRQQKSHFQNLPRELLEHTLGYIHNPLVHDRILLDKAHKSGLTRNLANIAKIAHLSSRLYAVATPFLYRLIFWPHISDSIKGAQQMGSTRGSTKTAAIGPRRKPEARFKYTRVLWITSLEKPRALWDLLKRCDKLRSVFLDGLFWDDIIARKLLPKLRSKRLEGLWAYQPGPRALEFIIRLGQLNWLVVQTSEGHPSSADGVEVPANLRVQSVEIRCLAREGIGSVKFLLDNISRASVKALGLYDLQNRDGIADYIFDPKRPFVGIKVHFSLKGLCTYLDGLDGILPKCHLRIETAGKVSHELYAALPDDLSSLQPHIHRCCGHQWEPLLATLRHTSSLEGLKTVILPRPLTERSACSNNSLAISQVCESRGIAIKYVTEKEMAMPFGAMFG